MKVYYLVYKLTNMVNGKIYIGCHMTKNLDDGYMGSGKRLAYAKKKYGVENFKKEILSTHESPEEMLAEEARLVNDEFLGRTDFYNLTCGGRGSWFYVNQTKTFEQKSNNGKLRRSRSSGCLGYKFTDGQRKARSHSLIGNKRELGLKHTDETKKKIAKITSDAQKGSGNSQFGTCWIFNEHGSIKIKKQELEQYLSNGYSKGRRICLVK